MDNGETEPSAVLLLGGEDEGEAAEDNGAPRGVSAVVGTFLLLFGSVFFFAPLFGLFLALSAATGLGEIVFLVVFFGIFLLVGGAIMLVGGAAIFHAITGRAILNINFGSQAEGMSEEGAGEEAVSTAFSYVSRDALLAELHGAPEDANASPDALSTAETESTPSKNNEEGQTENEPSRSSFWDVAQQN